MLNDSTVNIEMKNLLSYTKISFSIHYFTINQLRTFFTHAERISRIDLLVDT
jgi:hypothetical protein